MRKPGAGLEIETGGYESKKRFARVRNGRVAQWTDAGAGHREGRRGKAGSHLKQILTWNRNYVSEGGGSMNLGSAIPPPRTPEPAAKH